MANNQSSASIMSASMNMAITIFGFVLSALFIMVICCRLLCSRFRQANTLEMLQSGRRSVGSSSIERSLQGLEPSVVACFPTIKFNQHIFSSSEDNLCTICLGEYKEKEVLRILPRCGHAFHVSCIDAWLRQHSTCPVCRISLRVFSEWRQMSGPLISISAKPRFVPGALPDSIFEQPTDLQNVPVGTPTNLPKESVGWPVEVKGEGDPEMAESSSSRHYETAGLIEDESIKESLSIQAHSVPSNHVTLVRQPNTAADDSKRTLLCDSYVIDVPTAEQEESVLYLHDNVVMGWDRGPSVGCTTSDSGRTAAS